MSHLIVGEFISGDSADYDYILGFFFCAPEERQKSIAIITCDRFDQGRALLCDLLPEIFESGAIAALEILFQRSQARAGGWDGLRTRIDCSSERRAGNQYKCNG